MLFEFEHTWVLRYSYVLSLYRGIQSATIQASTVEIRGWMLPPSVTVGE